MFFQNIFPQLQNLRKVIYRSLSWITSLSFFEHFYHCKISTLDLSQKITTIETTKHHIKVQQCWREGGLSPAHVCVCPTASDNLFTAQSTELVWKCKIGNKTREKISQRGGGLEYASFYQVEKLNFGIFPLRGETNV